MSVDELTDDDQLIRVLYAERLTVDQFEKALSCRRCEGGGVERFEPEKTCPNCNGSGDDRGDNGWTYVAPAEWDLQVGDRVVVPPTPRSNDKEQTVVVIGLGSTFKIKSRLKHVVRRA